MNIRDFKAMVSLLDDSDGEVVGMVRDKIKGLGQEAIPLLEQEWDHYEENPVIQSKIEFLLQDLQTDSLLLDMKEWTAHGGEDLLRGLWLVSRLAYPENRIEKMRAEINKIYMDIWVLTHKDMHPADMLSVMNNVIFERMGFEPNVKSFHSPQNSLFNQVLEAKRGNPVTLSCLYILLAQKLDIPLYGVNLPNLFVMLFDIPGHAFYVNAFNKGQVFYRKDIDDYLKHMNLEPRKEYYQPCSHIEIVMRVLTNLAFAYQKSGDREREDQVNRILSVIHKS
ncbi:MAG: transglutaminase family protein [Leadbetterella sp.]|nr:transglutaminase family protein [Leadbetterella sp.]